jgi:hypothetical protein
VGVGVGGVVGVGVAVGRGVGVGVGVGGGVGVGVAVGGGVGVGVGVGDDVGAGEVTAIRRDARGVVEPILEAEMRWGPAGAVAGTDTFTRNRPDADTLTRGIPVELPSQRRRTVVIPRNPLPLTVIVWPGPAVVGALSAGEAASTEPGSTLPSAARATSSVRPSAIGFRRIAGTAERRGESKAEGLGTASP